MVPAVGGVPSPQSIVAMKSAVEDDPVGGSGLVSVKTATGPLKSGGVNTGTGKIVGSSCLTVGWVRAVVVSGASAMIAEPEMIVMAPPSSLTVML